MLQSGPRAKRVTLPAENGCQRGSRDSLRTTWVPGLASRHQFLASSPRDLQLSNVQDDSTKLRAYQFCNNNNNNKSNDTIIMMINEAQKAKALFYNVGCHLSIYYLFRATPGKGLKWSCSCRPTPQSRQLRIRAAPATYTTAHGHNRSLTQ